MSQHDQTLDDTTTSPGLGLYTMLARLRPLRSYGSKILLVAFVGTHVPLLALLAYFIISASLTVEATVRVLVVALAATLAGAVATMVALHHLLAPISLTSKGLRSYLDTKNLPSLPTRFTDEAGTLMADTSHTVGSLDRLVRYLESFDDLTGLPNRSLFTTRLAAILSERDDADMVALIVLDIDRFKAVNDGLGREAGDMLLRAVSQRLTTSLGDAAVLARTGADEFALADPTAGSLNAVIDRCDAMLALLDRPFTVDGRQIHVSASAGITVAPLDESAVDELLQHAETALYQAKGAGGGSYQLYSADMNARLQERLTIERDLRHALVRDELVVYYQPRVDPRLGTIVGVEALVRWQHPVRGLVSPAEFIPLAEENGLIIEIGEWVLRTACAQQRVWHNAGLTGVRVSVNLSCRQFRQDKLVEMVAVVMGDTGVQPDCLELEVTESLLMDDVARGTETLKRLRDLGITLALDDFGTGYSSLSYLRRLPIDTLKIDRSFVAGITLDAADAAIVDVIIALARTLHLSVTAEGVETRGQLDYLKTRGCDEIQGYFYSPAQPAAAITTLLSAGLPVDQVA